MWEPIETAPVGQRILVYNSMTGPYFTIRTKNGEAPMIGWGTQEGTWYPKPTHWMKIKMSPFDEKD